MITRKIAFEDKLDWDGLIEESETASFFQTREWLYLWMKHFGGDRGNEGDRGKRGDKVIGFYKDDSLVGIVPLEIADGKVSLLGTREVLGGELVTDYGDIIAKISFERIVWKEIFAKLKTQNSKLKTEQVEFRYIREDSPSFRILQELGAKTEEIGEAPYIDLPKSWEEYLAKLGRHQRHEVRRKMKKIEREGAVKVWIKRNEGDEGDEGNEGDVDEFFRLMALSNDKKEGFLSSRMKAFFRDVIKTFWQKSMLELCFLKLGEINIASALTFTYKDEVLLYNSGFDPEYSSLSPGLVLKALSIKEAIEKGKKRFDFLRGGERYKYDLGGKKRRLYKVNFGQI